MGPLGAALGCMPPEMRIVEDPKTTLLFIFISICAAILPALVNKVVEKIKFTKY